MSDGCARDWSWASVPGPANRRSRAEREGSQNEHQFVVIRCYGPPYVPDRPLEQQPDWEAHRTFMNGLEVKGIVRLGGPLAEREDVLLILRARNQNEIERLLADDPRTKSGILSTVRVSRWELRIGEVG